MSMHKLKLFGTFIHPIQRLDLIPNWVPVIFILIPMSMHKLKLFDTFIHPIQRLDLIPNWMPAIFILIPMSMHELKNSLATVK
jgi:hypothetical protein